LHGILSHRIKNPDYAYLTLSLNFYIVWSEQYDCRHDDPLGSFFFTRKDTDFSENSIFNCNIKVIVQLFTSYSLWSTPHHEWDSNIVTFNPAHGKMYSIQHYVMKLISDLQQIGGFLQVIQFPPPIKLTATV